MARTRGYRSYRGRGTKKKVLLAVLLCLVILAATAVIVIQEYVVYDADGTPHLSIPWQQAEEDAPQEEVDLVIQEPETPPASRILALGAAPLTQADWEETATALRDGTWNACAVTLKDADGTVYFESRTALPGSTETAEDTTAALAEMTRAGRESVYPIARISALLDPVAARSDVSGMGLMNTGGYIFYDGNNLNWLDPSKEAAQAYVSGFAVEAAELGFREIVLTDFSFPTEGSLDKITYPEAGTRASLRACLEAVRSALDQAGYEDVALSVEVPAAVVVGGYEERSGLALADLADIVERVYAAATAEQAAALSAAAAAAGVAFVPELTEEPAGAAASDTSYLLLPAA